MCISSYMKYMVLSLIIGSLIILSIFSENLYLLFPTMILAIIWSRITCPKCGESLWKDQNGWYIFTVRTTCRHCGQDTSQCEVESDEVTRARLEENSL